jgi:hypothetical protein
MRQAAVVLFVVVLAQVLPSHAESAELTGFGSIKFGMTAEEALAAIGGEGEWKSNTKLAYGFDWKAISREFEVLQQFRDDRASSVQVRHESKTFAFHSCISDSLRIVSIIEEKYQITPTIRQRDETRFYESGIITDSYFFAFEADSFVEVMLALWHEPRKCELRISYHPPSAVPLPF